MTTNRMTYRRLVRQPSLFKGFLATALGIIILIAALLGMAAKASAHPPTRVETSTPEGNSASYWGEDCAKYEPEEGTKLVQVDDLRLLVIKAGTDNTIYEPAEAGWYGAWDDKDISHYIVCVGPPQTTTTTVPPTTAPPTTTVPPRISVSFSASCINGLPYLTVVNSGTQGVGFSVTIDGVAFGGPYFSSPNSAFTLLVKPGYVRAFGSNDGYGFASAVKSCEVVTIPPVTELPPVTASPQSPTLAYTGLSTDVTIALIIGGAALVLLGALLVPFGKRGRR